ncbi:CRISPR-associated endonuclease/helicase Cas3 [Moorella thermoacetica]|uniref:CRISPR-associated endonuclease/helicase Cas3 n=1 Tax=Neomoorella thermoacetica TaxID=1525 RepID=A0A1J5NIG2_NEOTH|nr:CRISPR-associated endonuclease/helicase Cas3 [Moorella thermoacetica]
MTREITAAVGLSPGDFEAFFAEIMAGVSGERHSPYPWQKRLLSRVLQEGWPEALKLPTGTGKTSVLLISIFLLALEAGRPVTERKTGLRLFYVVDRRLIVDQAERLALGIMEAINNADENDGSILGRVKAALLAWGGEKPLDVLKLRGGLYSRLPWISEPNQPTIVLATVDQIGSRLLFRGYGTSPRQWPVQAGLAAIDAVYFLDEVHLSWPFARTLKRLREFLQREPLVAAGLLPLHPVIMSGTLPETGTIDPGSIFELTEEDWEEERLKKRLDAQRYVRIVERKLGGKLGAPVAPTESGGSIETEETGEGEEGADLTYETRGELEGESGDAPAQRASVPVSDGQDFEAVKEIAETLAEEARELLQQVEEPIAVIANRVATARLVFDKLRRYLRSSGEDDLAEATAGEETPGGEEQAGILADEDITRNDILLLTGRVRPFDRERLNKRLLEDKSRFPRVVVATQTIEVGVDLSFAAMVTEVAPCDALIQRLGRLNRDGRYDGDNFPRCIVVVPKGKSYRPYPYKEEDIEKCMQVLQSLPSVESLVEEGAGVQKRKQRGKKKADKTRGKWYDVSHRVLRAIEPELPLPAPGEAPPLTRVEIERLVQTSCAGVEPDIPPYLHGYESRPLDVYIVWREDLHEEDLDDASPEKLSRLKDYFSFMPPMAYEMLPLPFYTALKWLRREWADTGDVEGGAATDTPRISGLRPAYLWRPGAEDLNVLLSQREAPASSGRPGRVLLKPGDVVVVPASYGGVDAFGWRPPRILRGKGGRETLSRYTAVYAAGIRQGVDNIPGTIYLPLTTRHIERYVTDEEARRALVYELRQLVGSLEHLSTDELKKVRIKDVRPINGQEAPKAFGKPPGVSGETTGVEALARSLAAFLETLAREESAVLEFRELAGFLKEQSGGVALHPFLDAGVGEEEVPRGILFAVYAEDYHPDSSGYESESFDGTDEEAGVVREVELEKHLADVEKLVTRYVEDLKINMLKGWGTHLSRALPLAARYHDLGKLDPRLQKILYGEVEISATAVSLAKSGKATRNSRERERFYRKVDYPFGKRHEYTSVVLLSSPASFTALDRETDAVRELVFYLIGTHHGHGRPFFPPLRWGAKEPWQPVDARLFDSEVISFGPGFFADLAEATSLKSGWPERFFEHLERYGCYGLAYLEVILRLADWRASRKDEIFERKREA